MEISCIICSDLFTHNSEMVLNQCGHMFHYSCLIQWLERSKTCPQCRCRSTEKSLHRVYFNFVNTEHITDDIGTLQAKLDNANFKIQMLSKDVKDRTEKADLKEAQVIQLKELVSSLENKIRSYESALNGLKEKVRLYKSRASEADRLKEEVSSLKSTLDNVEKVQTAIHGTRAEVTEILRNETNIEALALLSATLKKSLIDKEHKTNVLQNRIKHSQNELMKYKRDYNTLESTTADLRKELEANKKSWEEEKKYLRRKIEELSNLSEEQKNGTPQNMNNSVQRILTESPAPLPRRRIDLLKIDNPESKGSPSVAENVMNILESDSPYLNTKTNYSSIFTARYSTALNQKKSIFKNQTTSSSSNMKPPTAETVYTGLGGQVKEDYLKFPDTKSVQTGLKRTKSSSAVPTTKFRKLAPLALKKITDYTK
ncbi:E3 ubiquitin-protein ligase TRAIP [Coccinella septempunctata]|uniref:E3 ubiquitin-protein ligase TRAIP n=1 Tax=Coccinella septempunctata TaxID=41139 RepID=UPI001D08C50F|nr:E3 ubiquitin-protein ligase TRAIP [Coccinella septempunctata]